MIWTDLLIALVTGVGLWAFLPRGVVLTRAKKVVTPHGEPVFDTWEIKNDGPLPIRFTSVRLLMPGYDEQLPWDGAHDVSLSLDDATADIGREDFQRPWNEVVVEPGDTLTAVMPNNTTLRIGYRRAGPFGVLERRRISIHGDV